MTVTEILEQGYKIIRWFFHRFPRDSITDPGKVVMEEQEVLHLRLGDEEFVSWRRKNLFSQPEKVIAT